MSWRGLSWLEFHQTVKNLRRLECKFDLDQSVRKSSQVNASARKPWPNGSRKQLQVFNFFRFWYSTKPLQVNIDIKTHLNKKTFWKVNLNLKQPDTWKTEQILWDAMQSAEFGTFSCHIMLPNAWEFLFDEKSVTEKSLVTLWGNYISRTTQGSLKRGVGVGVAAGVCFLHFFLSFFKFFYVSFLLFFS